jgi:hypothetical protein
MKPTLLRMREGKPGGGKGPLLSEDMSLTLTAVQDTLFQPRPTASRSRLAERMTRPSSCRTSSPASSPCSCRP